MTKNLVIKTDITDWRDEAYQTEFMPANEDEIIQAIEDGKSTSQVARATTVSRELGHAPSDLLRPSKIHILAGACEDISRIIRDQKTTIETESGKQYEVQTFVGKIGRPPNDSSDDDDKDTDDGGASYVLYNNPLGHERSINYLRNVVPGHIFNRFKQIYACDGDVKAEADLLIGAINEMVDRLD